MKDETLPAAPNLGVTEPLPAGPVDQPLAWKNDPGSQGFDLQEEKAKQLAAVQGFAFERNPDEAAKTLKYSRDRGMDFVQGEREMKVSPPPQQADWGQLVKDHPVLADYLADPGVASVARDDVPKLSLTERLFGGWNEMWSASAEAIKGDARTQKLAAIGNAIANGTATPEMLAQRDALEKEGAQPGVKIGFVPGIIPAMVGMGPAFGRTTDLALTGATAGLVFGGAGGALAGGVGAVPGAIGGALAGGGVGMSAGFAREGWFTERGLAMNEFSRMPGVSPGAARIAAELVGIANGALNIIPAEKVFNMAPALQSVLVGRGTRDLMRRLLSSNTGAAALARLAGRATESGITMALVSEAQELVREVGAIGAGGGTPDAAERQIHALTSGFQLGLGFGARHAIGHYVGDMSEVRAAEGRVAFFESLGQIAGDSKLRERMPEEYKRYANALLSEYGRIDEAKAPAGKVRELFQKEGLTPDMIERTMPEVARQLKIAADGDEIVIPMADLAAHIAPLKEFKTLHQDLRIGDELTAREATKVRAEVDSMQAKEKPKGEQPPALPGEKVYTDVYTKAINAGMSERSADVYGKVWRSFAETRGAKMKEDPFAYYSRRKLEVTNVDVLNSLISEKGRALNQSDVKDILTPEQMSLYEQVQKSGAAPEALDKLIGMLSQDELTGANGQGAWRRFMAKNEPGTYLSIDVNDLKRANDQFGGHASGDVLLKHVADTVGGPVRANKGKFFRSGGDEFSAHFRSPEEAARAVDAITKAMNAAPALFEGQHRASISMGLGADPGIADMASLKAKEGARASGRSGFGREGAVSVPDLSKGDVFFHRSEEKALDQKAPVTESPKFKKWFGKSQVIDAEGKPAVVYHGSGSGGFEIFDTKRQDKASLYGPGFYFTEDPAIASEYTEKGNGSSPSVYPVYLKIKNPFKVDSTAAELLPALKKFKAEPPPFEIKRLIDAAMREDPSVLSPDGAGAWIDNTEWAYRIAEKTGKNGEELTRPYFDYFIERAVKVIEKDLKDGHLPKNEGFGEEVIRFIERNVFDQMQEGGGNIKDVLERLGFDGITHMGGKNVGKKDHRVWIAFESEQIKSALGNSGDFNSKDPSILKQEQDANVRGRITFDDTRSWFKVTLTSKANLSTFLHESGHAFLEFMRSDAETDPATREEFAKINEWLGSKDGEHTDAQLEKFARGFEAWLMEGKAPSSKLHEVFRNVAEWMKMIYKTITGLGVTLDDNARGIFERMLATDEEIAKARETLGMVPDPEMVKEKKGYAEKFSNAMLSAQEEATQAAVRELRRNLSEEYKTITADVQEMTKHDRGYNAFEVLSGRPRLDGTEFTLPADLQGHTKLSRELVKEISPDAAKRLKNITEPGGLDPDTIAPYLGYASGEEMVTELGALQNRGRFERSEADRRMSLRYPGYEGKNVRGWIREKTFRTLHGEPITKILWDEASAAGENIFRKGMREKDRAAKSAANKAGKAIDAANTEINDLSHVQGEMKAALDVGKEIRQRKAIMEEYSQRRVSEMSYLEMQPGQFERAEARYAEEWIKASKKGDYAAAYEAKMEQIKNHYMWKATTKALDEIDALSAYGRKMTEMPAQAKLGKAGPQYREGVNALLAGIEFTKRSAGAIDRQASLEQFIKQMEEEGAVINIPPEIRAGVGLKNYKRMTLGELRAVMDGVKNIEAQARLKNKLFDGRQKRDFQITTTRLAEHIKANIGADYADKPGKTQNPEWWDKKKEFFRTARANLMKIEFLARHLDGGDTAGWAHELIYQPFADADVRKMEMTKAITQKIMEPFDSMKLADRLRWDKHVDFLGWKLRTREVLSLLLNMGNEGNRMKTVEGYRYRGWTEEMILKRLSELHSEGKITEGDLQFVDHTWRTVNELWPHIKALSERVTGVAPEKVNPLPFDINGRKMEGGYFPVVYDREKSQKAEQIAQRKTGDLFENNFLLPAVEKGFTQGRTQFSAPILLSLDVIPQHINEVVHYLTHYEAVRAVDRLTANAKVREAITEGAGREVYNAIRPWLQAIAADGSIHENVDFVDRTLRRLRLGSSIALLGFKVTTGLKQIYNVTGTAKEIGPKYTAIGIGKFMERLSRGEPFKEIEALSPGMKFLEEHYDRDMAQMFERMSGGFSEFGHLKNQLAHFSLAWIMINQKAVNAITWLGAHERAVVEGHSDPVRYADAMVRMSQAAGKVKDLAQIQRGSETKKMFTVMYTYFSVMANQLGEPFPRNTTAAKKMAIMAARWWWLVTLPVLLDQGKSAIPGQGKGHANEDGTDYLARITKEQLLFAGRTIPLWGEAAQAALSEREARYGAWYGTMIKGMSAAGKSGRMEPMSHGTVKSMIDLLGAAGGLPSGAAQNAYRFMDEYSRGNLEEPVQDILFRNPSEWE